MTRLRSDSSTTDDESVTSCNIVQNNTTTRGRSNTQGQVHGAILSDSHNNNYNITTSSDSEENSENLQGSSNYTLRPQHQQQYAAGDELDDRESEHNYFQPGDETTTTTTTSDDEDRAGYYNAQESPTLLEEAVYEFALSSARRLTIGHEQDYDLRPNFAILKPKTEESNNSRNSNNPSQQPFSTRPQANCNNINRTYPKTPDWFFNIPDTRSPFPEFESKLIDDTE